MNAAAPPPQVSKPKALACPNCGGPVELRGFAHTLSVICPSCHSVLDASTPVLQILQRVQVAQRIQPRIPLGSRGTFENTEWELIGFQIRSVPKDDYSWSEYLLFNPYKGFRYLSEYNGHWNYIRVESAIAERALSIGRAVFMMKGRSYSAFDNGTAVTSYVLGEFPWRVQVGEQAFFEDYVAPPYILSAEKTSGEVVWSTGEYRSGKQIWSAFRLPGSPPSASGVFLNQPSAYQGRVGSAWRTFLWLLVALAAVAFFFTATSQDKTVFERSYTFVPASAGEASFVTDYFDLTGRPSDVAIDINTDLDNSWLYLNFALIDQDTGQGYDFGREVSYYHGVDSDGSWSEGGKRNSVRIPAVPAGRYYLRIEPENDGKDSSLAPIHYDLEVRRDVPVWSWIWIAAGLLLIPPVYTTIRSHSFEAARWRESDFTSGESMTAKVIGGILDGMDD